jgi:hypothetical protein
MRHAAVAGSFTGIVLAAYSFMLVVGGNLVWQLLVWQLTLAT